MTKDEFMSALQNALEKHNVRNVKDILADYQEHFSHGLQHGKTESEIAAKLGSPQTIARAFETETLIAQVQDPNTRFEWNTALRVLGRLILIAPFNLIVFLIPGLIALSLLTAGWALAIAFSAASIGLLAFALKSATLAITGWVSVALGSAGLSLFGAGFLSALAMFFATKTLILGFIHYLQWNLKFVLEK